ncbi:MAG: hypothetical protein U5L00_10390 [Desulfovermiculus sp.]|nr:hypothetical protein [Desulfovermiculus sp.]
MKALDTNVIVRFLVKDDEAQAEIVRKRLKKAEEHNEVLSMFRMGSYEIKG